jgi:hypothetical protein
VLLNIELGGIDLYNNIAIWVVGTNPMINYGLNKPKRDFEERASSIIPPVFLTKYEDRLIENNLIELMPSCRLALICDDGVLLVDGTIEYNTVFGDKSLALEYLWDALEKSSIKFFPDWYGLFYSKYGIDLYKMNISGDFSLFRKWKKIEFSDALYLKPGKDRESERWFELEKIFGVTIVSTYFPSDKFLHFSDIN